ncbi:hypothetical protein AN1011.2 [Aspergillus nidulans FGSC A4]|nr:hypothetical protein AN1011.2 [Aspergillus nidulans FGSC A4]|eukprot:XP_658615.1 hypothetical protein AN1011.2 [Aspergillus nidulans FGSC A4]
MFLPLLYTSIQQLRPTARRFLVLPITHYGAMESSRSIPELKSLFIRAQIRILSESLEAPEDWRSYATEPVEEDLSDKVVGDVLQKLNAALKQHNRVIYSSQAIQHVAQQIASLYWASVNQATREVTSLERGVDKTVDLSSHPNITQLPRELYDQSASEEEQLRWALPCGTSASENVLRTLIISGNSDNGVWTNCDCCNVFWNRSANPRRMSNPTLSRKTENWFKN